MLTNKLGKGTSSNKADKRSKKERFNAFKTNAVVKAMTLIVPVAMFASLVKADCFFASFEEPVVPAHLLERD